ncbi:hypothetical protein ACOME3_001925 [Neoechinorhynchus agilis]
MSDNEQNRLHKIKKMFRYFPDFHRPGVLFVDVFPIFHNPSTCQDLMNICKEHIEQTFGLSNVDYIVGVELRGGLFGVPLGLQIKKPFVPVRKGGKLSPDVYQEFFDEDKNNSMEIQVGCMMPKSKVIVIDDLLGTGGTSVVVRKLIEKSGCEILEFLFITELLKMNGRKKLETSRVHSIFKI